MGYEGNGMTKEERAAEIRAWKARLLINYKEIGGRLGISGVAVSQAAALKWKSRRVRAALEAAGIPGELFEDTGPVGHNNR